MTDDAAPPADRPALVDFGSLTLGRRLGQGGQGTVHEVLNKRINETAPGGGWPVVYKEYSPAVLPLLDTAALDACVRLLGGLSAADGRWLCEKTAWPAALIGRQGQACGFLMRAVPDRFRFALRTLTAAGGSGTERLATMEFLLNDDAYIAGVGLSVSDKDRLLLLADLAATMAHLHRLGVAVGDVSPKNLLFSLGAQPECFLIDCDAMRVHGATALPQAETPDWQVPQGEERATPAGDVHKLGLLAVRLFARDQTATDPAALAAISPALGDMARASLGPDPSLRPSPSAWAEQLKSAAATASSKPTKPRGSRKPGGATPPNPPAPPGRGATGGPSGRASGPLTPKPSTPPFTGKAIGVLAGIVAAVLLIVLVAANQHSSDTANVSPGPYPTTPGPDPTTPSPDPTTPGPDPTTPDPTPTTPDSPSPSDLIGSAQVGDCFDDNGTTDHPDLSADAACATGSFKVLQVNNNTTDLSSCDNVTNDDRSVSSPLSNVVLCLSYQNSGGTGYHARQGDCVFGTSTASDWDVQTCQAGAFKVLASYRGTSDSSKCNSWPNYNYWRHYGGGESLGIDVLLCLSMVYPDDAGYATLNECLSKSGSGNGATFTNTGSCSTSNVVVSGRIGSYEDSAFCGNDGWTSWQSPDYPQFAYTVCWRWNQ